MPLAEWALMPPEVIAGQVMTGDNGASLTAAVATYQALAAMLTTEGATMAATSASTAANGWEGLGGTAMMATAMPYVAALETLSGWIEQAGAVAAAILDAYTTTRTSLIPVPACELNRAHFTEASMNNWFGVRTPEIIFLTGQYSEYWTQNASLAGSYEAFVTGLLATLAAPPPPAPLTANPAGPAGQAAALGEAAANGALNAGLHTGLQGVNEAAGGTQAGAQATAAPAEATQMMSQIPQLLGQVPQMMGQLPQMLGQVPQMLGQFPQMAMGMLGPLTQGMNADAATAGLDTLSKTSTQLASLPTGANAAGSIGGSGLSGGNAVLSSFTRPTGSFNTPGPPKLPAGWSATQAAVPEVASTAQPSTGAGAGGLYGAPGMLGQDRGKENSAPVRTMRLTTAPAPGRGE